MAAESEEEEGGERREVAGQKYSQSGQLVPSSVGIPSNHTKLLWIEEKACSRFMRSRSNLNTCRFDYFQKIRNFCFYKGSLYLGLVWRQTEMQSSLLDIADICSCWTTLETHPVRTPWRPFHENKKNVLFVWDVMPAVVKMSPEEKCNKRGFSHCL